MLKVAMLATAVLAVASTGAIGIVASTKSAAPAAESRCHPGQPLDLACDLKGIDADGNGTISAAELAEFAMPAATPLQPAPESGLAFQDAATEPGPVLPASLAPARPQPLVPALFALGGLVILLRRRPS
ncbi:hypothetical protein [Scleromatobacter humisilvae]|uniref:EF-hand domain-containing protein n=1 Tax=Scleromatobacter humisilvae TaxID=2897159 RepID=A0A9X2C331_9BURK|nr:hypothetical protein [Scleromatobacter humisilvae]MCK9687589.1 hypothetical protein [Scleromatobacter humisilvae]